MSSASSVNSGYGGAARRTPFTLVVGLGNPILGDDGIGWRVADAVRAIKPDIEVDCLALGGLSLMERLVGYGRVIIIDSIQTRDGRIGPAASPCPASGIARLDTTAGHHSRARARAAANGRASARRSGALGAAPRPPAERRRERGCKLRPIPQGMLRDGRYTVPEPPATSGPPRSPMLVPMRPEELEAQGQPTATFAIIGICFALHLARAVGLLQLDWDSWGLVPGDLALPALGTHVFLHASWLHLIGASLLLLAIGPALEMRWGRPFYLGFLLLAAVLANGLYALTTPGLLRPLVGFGGGTCALLGAGALLFWSSGLHYTAPVALGSRGPLSLRAPALNA